MPGSEDEFETAEEGDEEEEEPEEELASEEVAVTISTVTSEEDLDVGSIEDDGRWAKAEIYHLDPWELVDDIYAFLDLIHDNGTGSRVFMCEEMKRPAPGAKRRRFVIKMRFKGSFPSMEAEDKWLKMQLRLMRMKRHPHVLQPMQIIEDERCYYIVFERIMAGCSMFQFLLNSTSILESSAKHLIRDILQGLDHLHKNGLAHRDVKPENILLEWRDAAGLMDADCSLPLLTDSAKAGVNKWTTIAREGSTTGLFKGRPRMHRCVIHPYIIDFDTCDDINHPSDILCGTPLYMAPEAFTSNAGFAGDLYGIGVIVYALLLCDLPGPSHCCGAEDVFHSLDGSHVTSVPMRALQRLERRVKKAIGKIDWNHEIWNEMPLARELVMQLINTDPAKRGESAADVLKNSEWFSAKRKRYAKLAMTKKEKEQHELYQLKNFLDARFASIELAFAGLDVDGDNGIELEELTMFLKNRLGYPGDAKAVHQDLDKDGDGKVTWDEFTEQLSTAKKAGGGAMGAGAARQSTGWAELDRQREARKLAGESGGMVTLQLIEAKGLVEVDFNTSGLFKKKDPNIEPKGSSDPYVRVMISPPVELGKAPKEKEVFRTKIIYDTLDPVWKASCQFPMAKEEKLVVLRIMDHDPGPSMLDDEMGQVTLPMPMKVDRWFTVEPTPNCKNVSGELHIKVNYSKAGKEKKKDK